MYLRNTQEYGSQETCVIDNYGLHEHIFLVFSGFFLACAAALKFSFPAFVQVCFL